MRRKPFLTPEQARAVQAPLDRTSEILTGQPAIGAKAADRAFLDSIQDVIEKAQRESAARETLKSTVEMRKRLAAEQRQRRDAELAAAISAVAAKEKEKGARKNAAPVDNGPTPERKAKLLGVEEIRPPISDEDTRAIAKAHVTQDVAEFYAKHLTYEELQGARYLMQAWHEAQSGQPKVVGSYDGIPGVSFGPRRGGVAATKLDAHNNLIEVEAIVRDALRGKGHMVLKWFWGALKLARAGAPMTSEIEALGRALAPAVKDQGRLWGIAFGRLTQLWDFAYGRWVANEKAMQRRESTPQQIAMRRAQRIKRMHEQGLLRADQDGPAFKNGGKG